MAVTYCTFCGTNLNNHFHQEKAFDKALCFCGLLCAAAYVGTKKEVKP